MHTQNLSTEPRITVRIPKSIKQAIDSAANEYNVNESVIWRSALGSLCRLNCGFIKDYPKCAKKIMQEIENLPFDNKKYLLQKTNSRSTFRIPSNMLDCVEGIARAANVPQSLIAKYAIIKWSGTAKYLPP